MPANKVRLLDLFCLSVCVSVSVSASVCVAVNLSGLQVNREKTMRFGELPCSSLAYGFPLQGRLLASVEETEGEGEKVGAERE